MMMPSKVIMAPSPRLDVLLAHVFGPTLKRRVAFEIGKLSLVLSQAPPDYAPHPSAITVHCSINGEAGEVKFSTPLLNAIIGEFAPGLATLGLDSNSMALLLEAALAEQLDTLETQFGVIKINSVEYSRSPPAESLLRTTFFLEGLGGPTRVAQVVDTHFPDHVAKRLLAIWSGRVDGDVERDPQIDVAVRLGCVKLGRSAVDSLMANDVILLDDTPIYAKQLCLIIGERVGALGDVQQQNMILREPIASLVGTPSERLLLAPLKNSDHVTLVADVARRQVAMSQLLQADFSTIELPRRLEQGVDLYDAGTIVASAVIVRVGKAIGLRLVSVRANG